MLSRCVIDRAPLLPSHGQVNRCGKSLLARFVSLLDALGSIFLLCPAGQHWAVETGQDDAEWHRRSRFDTGLVVCLFSQEPA